MRPSGLKDHHYNDTQSIDGMPNHDEIPGTGTIVISILSHTLQACWNLFQSLPFDQKLRILHLLISILPTRDGFADQFSLTGETLLGAIEEWIALAAAAAAATTDQTTISSSPVEPALVEIVTLEGAQSAEPCVICLESLGAGDGLRGLTATRLPCRHMYHGDCIGRWLGMRNTCPVCRVAVDERARAI